MRKKGHKTGKPPFGMKAKKIGGVRKFVEDKVEQKIIAKIMILQSSKDYNSISEVLKRDGYIKHNRMLENSSFIKKIVKKQEKLILAINKCLTGLKL